MKSKLISAFLGLSLATLVFFLFIQTKYIKGNVSTSKLIPFISSKNSITVDFKKYEASQNTISKLELNDSFKELINTTKSINGTYSIYIKDLITNESYEYNSKQNIYAASLFKVPVALATYKAIQDKKITNETKIQFYPKYLAGGTGTIQENPKQEYTVSELLSLLLKESDNIAQNMLIEAIGYDYLNNTFRYLIPNNTSFNINNISNTKDVSLVFEKIYFLALNKADNKYIDSTYAKEMINTMLQTSFDDRISKGLGNDTLFAHKIGSWGTTGSWHDCGIAFLNDPVVVCVMSKDTTFENLVKVSVLVGRFLRESF